MVDGSRLEGAPIFVLDHLEVEVVLVVEEHALPGRFGGRQDS